MLFPAARNLTIFLHALMLAAPFPGFAEESPAPVPAEMETVTVTGQAEDQLTGVNTLKRETLDHLPARNGSLNEAIGILPGVQLPELGRTSTTAGEIAPPKVSISGGKSYQNNFLIDGLSNNSLLDPEFDDPSSLTLVPGHPQALFLDTDLVEQISVYRYNVPARYGSFTGGVVDVSTRDPGPEFFGEAVYRTTRHEWTEFHLDPAIEDTFENSVTPSYQPEFEKHDAGLLLNLPLAANLNLLTSYQINSSRITLTHLLEEETQSRRNENYFAKLAYDLSAFTRLTATVQHAPYEAEYLYPNSLGSEFTIDGGGDQASLGLEHAAAWGSLSLTGAWKYSENRRDAPADLYTWAVTPGKPWGALVGTISLGRPASFEGSVGSLESTQEGFQLKGDVQTRGFATGFLAHQVTAGVDFEQATGTMRRDEPTNFYFNPRIVAASFVCPPGSDACIDGEQYLRNRQYYAPDKARATINLLDGYLEDVITWDRLEVRPGVRVAYDDFMENTNLSPRLAASYDLFGNRQTLLIGGLNRYYGRTLLTYKLREASIPAQNYTRNSTTLAWIPGAINRPYRYSELDTPYTDEAVLGVDQELFGGRLKITGLRREGRDEFAQERVDEVLPGGGTDKYYRLTNRGESHHQEISGEWERSWDNHFLAVNVTWQESETNNENYATSIELGTVDDLVWYDGEYVSIDDVPRRNFSRNWTGNLIYSARLPLGVTFTNVTRYRSGYEALVLLGSAEKAALGIAPTVTAYRNEELAEAWVFDWRFDWDLFRDRSLVPFLEVNNVFDEDVELGNPANSSSSTSPTYIQNYELGRQVWVGMTYRF